MTAAADVFGAMFCSVLSDIKILPPAFENVCSKAVKLSTQLNNMANCLASFVDSVQVISDNANNIKGASRDIGASLTRFCFRQKSLENLIRSLALALNECFAPSIYKKVSEWRQRVLEIERRRVQSMKKWKQKTLNMSEAFGDAQHSYSALLTEQRNQFVHFVNALLPVINAEIALLDEGAHVKQVRDSIATTANENDTYSMIEAIIEDAQLMSGNLGLDKVKLEFTVNGTQDERVWQRRMSSSGTGSLSKSENLKALQKSSCESVSQISLVRNLSNWSPSSMSSSGFSQSFNDAYGTVGETGNEIKNSERRAGSGFEFDESNLFARPHTITLSGCSEAAKRLPISVQTFMAPLRLESNPKNLTPLSTDSQISKPPLPMLVNAHKPYEISDVLVPLRNNVLSISANNLPELSQRNARPLSLSGCDLHDGVINNHFQNAIDKNKVVSKNIQDDKGDSRCSTLLIAETLHQIDQLGVELDSYCQNFNPVISGSATNVDNASNIISRAEVSFENVNITQQRIHENLPLSAILTAETSNYSESKVVNNSGQAPVRYRPNSIRPPPPLPERRNSTITAATPTAPSIVDIRSSVGSGSVIYNKLSVNHQFFRPPSGVSWPPDLNGNGQGSNCASNSADNVTTRTIWHPQHVQEGINTPQHILNANFLNVPPKTQKNFRKQ